MLSSELQYNKSDAFTKNFGADKIYRMLAERYGERYHAYRRDWQRAGPDWLPDFPVNLVLDLVDKCNLACPQCLRAPDLIKGYGGFIGTLKFLDYPVVERILDECGEHGLPSANIGGSGECTMHPDFIKVVRKVMEIGVCELRIISNGLRLKGAIVEGLIEAQPHMVSVSIDGFSPESFAISRGKAHRYQEVVDNTVAFAKRKRELGSAWPLLRVSFVRQEGNKHEVEDFVEFWSEYADMIDVQVYHDRRATEFNDDFDCFEPFKRMSIWAYGGTGPCCGFPGIVYNVGDYKSQTIHEIWHGEQMQKMRAMMLEKDYQLPCLKCQGSRTVV